MNAIVNRLTYGSARLGLLTALLIVLMSLAVNPVTVGAQHDGTISGTITNGTTGEPVADAEVTLTKFFDQTGANSESSTTTSGEDGTFRFDGLDTSDGLAYSVTTRYLGVRYGSSAMILISDVPEQTADITVFDTTTDQRRLTISSRALIVTGIERDTGRLTVTDAYTFQLAGGETLIEGPDGYSIRFPVPENVGEITPRAGFDFSNARIEETSVRVTTPIRPGESSAGLDYVFLYTGSQILITVEAGYLTESLQILVPTSLDDSEIDIRAEGSPLLDGGIVSISGRDFHVWSASGLAPDSPLPLTVTGLPRPPTSNTLSTIEPAILAGLALLAATAITGWVVVKRGLHRPRPVVLAPAVAAPLDERRALLSTELRDLQAQWEAGEVDEAAYQSSRRAILEDLRRISRQYRGLGDDE